MRIGIDAKRAFMNQSGLGVYNRMLILGLREFYPEHNLFLYTPKQRISFLKENHSSQIIEPTNFIYKKISPLWRSFKITDSLIEHDIDVYHGTSAELPFNIGRFKGKKVVTIHDLIFEHYPEFYAAIDRQMYRYKTKKACRDADAIITVSNQTKMDLVNLYGVSASKIEIIPLPVDSRFTNIRNEEKIKKTADKYALDKPFILCVNSFNPRKNQLKLVEAFAQSKLSADYELILIGRGTTYLEEVQNLIRYKNLSGVRILTTVDDAELIDFYQAASLFVYPSLYEGYGLPIVEAMACGTTVVCSNISSMPEVGVDAVGYFNPHEAASILSSMEEVLESQELKTARIQRGLDIVEKEYGLKIFVERTMKVYR